MERDPEAASAARLAELKRRHKGENTPSRDSGTFFKFSSCIFTKFCVILSSNG